MDFLHFVSCALDHRCRQVLPLFPLGLALIVRDTQPRLSLVILLLECDANGPQFRAYTDPLNANNGNSLNPPSIPPPPPPPPPLNIPPSRARLQLAARLAMNKRNAAAAAANGSQDDSSTSTGESSGAPSSFTLPTTSNDHLRNPFADDEDDEVNSGSGSDNDDDVDALGEGAGSGGWNRGSWWRGVVRSARRGKLGKEPGKDTERFGDGRDDSDSDGPGDEDDDDIEDEEFGDFAMPEVEGRGKDTAQGGAITGIDPAREKILLKPLPVHPSAVKSGVSPFSGLWPFSTQTFKAKDKEDDGAADPDKTPTAEKAPEFPVVVGQGGEEVVGEDGQRIDRAVEAKSRTSIEDPDEDEVVHVGGKPKEESK